MDEGPVAPPKTKLKAHTSMQARYSSSCPNCGEWISEGDTILGAYEKGWVCTRCAVLER